MSAFVKLVTASRSGGYLGIPHEDRELVRPTHDNLGILVGAVEAEVLSGDAKGTMVEEVKANQVVRIRPVAKLRPTRYTIVQSYNPKLAEYGSVSQAPIVQPDADSLQLTIKAYKPFRVNELDWMFLFYAID